MSTTQQQPFSGRLLMVGYGSIGRGVLPLLLRHIAIEPSELTIICPSAAAREAAKQFGVAVLREALTEENFRQCLEAQLKPGDFLLNLSVEVSSQALLAFCQAHQILYLDTCTEPWAGGYNVTDP
jgi:homospermidine synthase